MFFFSCSYGITEDAKKAFVFWEWHRFGSGDCGSSRQEAFETTSFLIFLLVDTLTYLLQNSLKLFRFVWRFVSFRVGCWNTLVCWWLRWVVIQELDLLKITNINLSHQPYDNIFLDIQYRFETCIAKQISVVPFQTPPLLETLKNEAFDLTAMLNERIPFTANRAASSTQAAAPSSSSCFTAAISVPSTKYI